MQYIWKTKYFETIITIFIVYCVAQVQCYLRFTEQSCTDLTPRNFDDYSNAESLYTSTSRFRAVKRKRHNGYAEGTIPFTVTATGKRYRRDGDVIVQIEGESAFDGLLLQARALPGNTEIVHGTASGGVGVVGQFRFLPFPYKYLTCFDTPASSVVDQGKPIKLGNVSFVWRSPDQDVGDVRFVASILRGTNYWIVVSNTLIFNPFPISSYSCGSLLACFRVCPYDQYACQPRHALYVFTHSIDGAEKREVQFTIGGRVRRNNSYIAFAFGNDFESLKQADMMACFLDRGRAKVEHLLIESIYLPPYQHQEPIEVDDYDLDGNMLWCRFRRSINPSTSINPNANMYHFYFTGTLDYYFHRFILPRRQEIYTSAFKRNFTAPINEIISEAPRFQGFSKLGLMMFVPFIIFG